MPVVPSRTSRSALTLVLLIGGVTALTACGVQPSSGHGGTPSGTAGATSTPTTVVPTPTLGPPVNGLPQIVHRGGVYNAPISGFGLLPSAMKLVVGGDDSLPVAASSLRFIDTSLLSDIYRYLPHSCLKVLARQRLNPPDLGPCPFSSERQSLILQAVKARLAALEANRQVVAFDILDDYFGTNPGLLRRIHDLVHQSDGSSIVRRPAICTFVTIFGPDHGLFDRAVRNYSPQACDMVGIYAYDQPGVPAQQADWSMKTELPYVKARLRARGWNPARAPLIGIVQGFGQASDEGVPWHPPTPDELQKQVVGFCQGGAAAIIGYAWTQSRRGKTLGNDASLRKAFLAGLAKCEAIWRHLGRP